MSRVTARNVFTGSFQGEQMQTTARAVARATNDLAGRVEDLELAAVEQVVLLKDFTTTAATAQDTLLVLPVSDGDLICLEYWGAAGCSGSANGMKYAIKAPAGSTIQGVLDSSSTTEETDQVEQISAVNTLTAAVHTVNGATRPDYINVRLKIVGDGVVMIQAASTTAGNTTTIAALALMRKTTFRLVQ